MPLLYKAKNKCKSFLELSAAFFLAFIFLACFASALEIVTIDGRQVVVASASFLNNSKSGGGAQVSSVVGDAQNCGKSGSPTKEWTLSSGESVYAKASTYCSSKHGLFDVFIKGLTPWLEFSDNFDGTDGLTCGAGSGPCNVQLYCCAHSEPSSSSDCRSWIGQDSVKKTASCVSWQAGYKCTANGVTENKIPYIYDSFYYCTSPSVTCWYVEGSSCSKRVYAGLSSCPASYQGNTLYSSESTCLKNIPPSCSDIANTHGSCDSAGSFKKENGAIYLCKKESLGILCWEKNASMGDDDYCTISILCDWGEYDCDWQFLGSQCAPGLYCDVDANPFSSDGCCYKDIEKWDPSSSKCKYVDGHLCDSDVQCYGGYCRRNACSSVSYAIGDGYCDSGESCSNSPADCGKCDDVSCSADSECMNKHCVHGACYKDAFKIGDGYCDMGFGEDNQNSPNDCKDKMVVLEILEYPKEIEQGRSVQIKARIKNEGTYNGEFNLEAGIVPDYWGEVPAQCAKTSGVSISSANLVQSYYPITKCCTGNEYYGAVKIRLAPSESENVTISLTSPTIHSVDVCNNNRIAWDKSYSLVVGLYGKCGGGYANYKAGCIKVKERMCGSDNNCWAGEYCKRNGSSLQGVCALKQCINECAFAGVYSCRGSEITLCQDINGDKCFERKHIDYCAGEYVCKEGGSNCVYSPPKTKLEIDYSGSKDIRVNKQSGDILKLRLHYNGDESITLDYNKTAFILLDCFDNFEIGEFKECTFKVAGNSGIYSIGIRNGEKGSVRIINEPRLIIVSDRGRLMSRYNNNEEEVSAVLKEAYKRANDEEGVVYNLGDYISKEIWTSMVEYDGGQYAVK